MAFNQNINIDDSRLRAVARLSPAKTTEALEIGFRKIKDEWAIEATNEAPIQTGNLRSEINGESSAKGVLLRDNAVNGGFNYSYYIHEVKGNDYLDRAVDEDKFKAILEDELRAKLGRLWGGG